MNSDNIHSAISSPESAAGVMPCDSQDGQTTDLAGQEARLVSHSATQESRKPKQMPDTSGQCFSISSESVALQTSLENKLRQRLGQGGSMIYKMTWKQKVTPRGRSYCQLVASAATTSASESGLLLNGWPTPTTRDHKDTGDLSNSMTRKDGKSRLDCVPRVASLAGWPTPRANDNVQTNLGEICEHGSSWKGQNRGATVATMAQIAGWPTPQAIDASGKGRDGRLKKDGNRNPNLPGSYRRDLKDQAMIVQPMRLKASGQILIGSSAEMESGGQLPNTTGWQLNPMFSGCFLMGYPLYWNLAGMRAAKKPKRK